MATEDKKLTELLGNESFIRWIKGTASNSEKQYWEAWVKQDPVHRELSEHAEIFFQMRLELDPADDVELQLNRLNQQIARAKKHNNPAVVKKNHRANHSGGYRFSIAASIVLLLSIVGLLSFYLPESDTDQNEEPEFEIAETESGETSSLKFSDGSIIRLNTKSSLRYSLEQFNTARVEVWLQGEGYFDIVTNPDGVEREFIVHTDNGRVRVLGTKFYMDTRFRKTSVVLEEGRVAVSRNESQNVGSAEKTLQPGERALLDESSSEITVQNVNVDLFTAWIEGEMEFRDTSLRDIAESIEMIYNVTIDVESPELWSRRITGTVQNPDLEILLTGLEKILGLQINQIEENKFLISHQPIQYE